MRSQRPPSRPVPLLRDAARVLAAQVLERLGIPHRGLAGGVGRPQSWVFRAGLPVIVKCIGGWRKREILFYEALYRRLARWIPACVYADYASGVLVLERVPGRTLRHSVACRDWSMVGQVVAHLQMASLSDGGPSLGSADTMSTMLRPTDLSEVSLRMREIIARLYGVRARREALRLLDITHELVLDARLKEGPVSLLHGDLHPGNILIGAGHPKIVDWAHFCRGPVGLDCGILTGIGPADHASGSMRLSRAFLEGWLSEWPSLSRESVRLQVAVSPLLQMGQLLINAEESSPSELATSRRLLAHLSAVLRFRLRFVFMKERKACAEEAVGST